jgi:hypothetical protein
MEAAQRILHKEAPVMARHEQIDLILDRLFTNIGPDVIGAVAVGTDGIVIASRLTGDTNVDRVGAVAAALIGMTRRVSGELKIGWADELILKAYNGVFMVVPVDEQTLLAINLRQGSNIGLARLEARDAAESISRLFVLESRSRGM